MSDVATGTAIITYEHTGRMHEWRVGCTSKDNEQTLKAHFDKWRIDSQKWIGVRFEWDNESEATE